MKNNLLHFPVDRMLRAMPPDPPRGWKRVRRIALHILSVTIVTALVVGLVIVINVLFA